MSRPHLRLVASGGRRVPPRDDPPSALAPTTSVQIDGTPTTSTPAVRCAVAASVPDSTKRVLDLIDELERLRDDWTWLVQATRCPHCKAEVGMPCQRPNGAPYERARTAKARYHAPRIDIAANHFNHCCAIAWRGDLVSYGIEPARVLAEIHRTGLYRVALRDGRIRELGPTGGAA